MLIQAGVLCKWTRDSQRLLLEHFDTIHNSPSHIYHSALPFCPSSSWLHKHYSGELSQEVKVVKGLPAGWGTCSRTVSLGSYTRGLSCWNNTIAAASFNGDIIILDAITGSQTAVLSGHTEEILCLAFSSDGKLLVSGGFDKTVKLWDMQTGGVVKTFSGHTDLIQSVSISAGLTKIASGSWDKTMRLWNVQTGECHQIIKQPAPVYYVCFSPINPQHLISVHDDKVWHWDTDGHQIKPPHDGSYIAFSSDGAQFVSCNGTTVKVQNSSSGVTAAEFHVTGSDINCCCFSPDGRLIAVAVGSTVYIWDITSSVPYLIETFVGHTEGITSLAFSPPSSLISASIDQSVKFWQIGVLDPVLVDQKSISPTSARIMSITLQAKDGVAITSDSDGVVKTWDISTGLCKASFQTPARGSNKRDAQLINGKLIFVWHADWKINIWDVEKGDLLLAVKEPWWGIQDLRISGDGFRVFCLGEKCIQAWSVQTGEIVGGTNFKPPEKFRSLVVDGLRVWACYPDSEYQGWDFGTPGSPPVQLPNTPPYSNGALFWDTDLSRVKDKAAGKVVFQLSGGYRKPIDVQWNDQYLVVCFIPIEVLILDFSHMLL